MEDRQIYEAELAYGKMYDDADFISELQSTIYDEIKGFLWSNSEEPHNLKAAEEIMKQHTGSDWDISEILFELIDSEDGTGLGVTCNQGQIYGFATDLMNGTMNSDSGWELASILSEYVTQDVASIEEHHKQDSYDGPDTDADGDY
jgi:hypothetical protein